MKYFKQASSDLVFTRSYSKWDPTKNRREIWPETVQRYLDFINSERGSVIPSKVLRKIQEYVLSCAVMPSMRALWAAGDAARKDNTTMYNCSYLAVDSVEAFSECLYILMCGTGVGFSVEQTNVLKLPSIPNDIQASQQTFVIPDDKAGWADSVKVLMNGLYSGQDIQMDYNQLRPQGARLATMGGKSSGPAPLANLHGFIRNTFYKAKGRQLTSLEAHDIMNEIASIVVVGGVRRSSQISISDLTDTEMRNAKVGFNFPVRRYMANNSAVYNDKPNAIDFLKEWAALAESGSGERGIFNRGSALKNKPKRRNLEEYHIVGTNPCQPAFAKITLADGREVTMGELKVGDVLLNCYNKETVVLKKWSTGIKPVYAYGFEGGSFVGTENHKVVINKEDEQIEKSEIENLYLNKHIGVISTVFGYRPLNSKVYLGEFEVFDITVSDDTHTYTTNGAHVSNCGEITLRNMEFCNLSEVVIRAEDDLDSLLDKVECATWIGVIQSSFTNFPYLRKQWQDNCNEERLLGVSLTGQMDNPDVLTEGNLKALKARALKVSKRAAEIMGISASAAVTCVKPSGTVSQLVDAASGIHPRFDKFYIRRYRLSSMDALYKLLRAEKVPLSPENGQRYKDYTKAEKVYKETGNEIEAKKVCSIFRPGEEYIEDFVNTWVVSYPIKAPENSITVKDVTAIEQLEHYKRIQTYWCEHNASITVYVKPDEWFEVGNWVYKNWDIVNGVSFLPYSEHTYEQAPYESITEEEYNKLLAKQKNIDYSKLSQFELEDETKGNSEYACVGNSCEL